MSGSEAETLSFCIGIGSLLGGFSGRNGYSIKKRTQFFKPGKTLLGRTLGLDGPCVGLVGRPECQPNRTSGVERPVHYW